MDSAEKKRLEADGWKFGTVAEFLEMTPEEAELMELRHTVRMRVREARLAQGITQGELAKRLKTSQPRIVALEGTATDVGLELGFRALFALGVKSSDVHIKGSPKSMAKTRNVRLSRNNTKPAKKAA